MTRIKTLFSLIALIALTQGCIMYRLAELRNTTPSGNGFQTELSKLYMDFATQEEKEYDWANSWHFADKGLMLAYGKDAPPEELSDWDIPADKLPEMERARAMLMSVLTPELMQNSPSRTADAQFYFDCWVEQQEEGWQKDDIAYCRDNLMSTLEGLHASDAKPLEKTTPAKTKSAAKKAKPVAAASPAASPAVAPAKKSAPQEAEPAHTESVSYAVFFETDKAELSPPGKNVLGEVIDSLKGVSNYEVVLRVNSDKSVVDALSNERAQVVKKRLIEGGVAESAIRRSDAPAAPAAAPLTRRVEIFLNE